MWYGFWELLNQMSKGSNLGKATSLGITGKVLYDKAKEEGITSSKEFKEGVHTSIILIFLFIILITLLSWVL